MSNQYVLKVRKNVILGDHKLPKGTLVRAEVKSKVQQNHKDEWVEYFELSVDALASETGEKGGTVVFTEVEPFVCLTECEHIRFDEAE